MKINPPEGGVDIPRLSHPLITQHFQIIFRTENQAALSILGLTTRRASRSAAQSQESMSTSRAWEVSSHFSLWWKCREYMLINLGTQARRIEIFGIIWGTLITDISQSGYVDAKNAMFWKGPLSCQFQANLGQTFNEEIHHRVRSISRLYEALDGDLGDLTTSNWKATEMGDVMQAAKYDLHRSE